MRGGRPRGAAPGRGAPGAPRGRARGVITVVSFVVVIGLLILIHELGHFLVARWVGVGVERFSIGFGPVLLRWRGRETEYCLSAIPMGGYVKMLGEENPLEGGGASAGWDPAKAFAVKALWARFLIVLAGPAMNLVLAAVIFATMLVVLGRPVLPAVIGRVTAGAPAAEAGVRTGDRVTSFAGRPVANWEDLGRAVSTAAARPVELEIERGGARLVVSLVPRRTTVPDLFGEPKEMWDIGVGPLLTPQVRTVTPGSPAERAGIRPGDTVRAVAGEPIYTPEELTQAIQKRPGGRFTLTVERAGRALELPVTADRIRERAPNGTETEVGRIGIGIDTQAAVTYVRSGPLAAVGQGLVQTWNMTQLTVTGLWKLLTRQIDSSNIGGPLQIATEAGRQARQGAGALAFFTAIISINLGVLNLLPVPMLDGGHLFFFVIEAVLGRPLSLRKREVMQQLGFVLLMLLMVYALYNDLMRLDAFRLFR
ncbi:MAG: RIP metalloprotease RseP [Candidatus Rokuibacteriota bacterium]|nr:MAG: RIP metalloprotease RseP [Candidatus Rokubacteria bacterium]